MFSYQNLLFICFLKFCSCQITEISLGKIQGELVTAYQDKSIPDFFKSYGIPQSSLDDLKFPTQNFSNVEVYRGIPYGETDNFLGESRLSSQTFEGIKNYTAKAPVCPQLNGGNKISKNCLTLDIYKPETSEEENLPVFVWIHGGGFTTGGSGGYDGTFLASTYKQVVVAIQYRLDIGGFLFESQGIKDARLALEWVKNEIKNFNGDPDNVHIAGESAGAAIVSYLAHLDAHRTNGLMNEYKNGNANKKPLFKKVSIMSGSAFASWANKPSWKRDQSIEKMHVFLKKYYPSYECNIWDGNSVDLCTLLLETKQCIRSFINTFSESEIGDFLEQIDEHDDMGIKDQGIGPAWEDFPEMNLQSNVNFTGYEITAGTLNADGMVFFGRNMRTEPIDVLKKEVTEMTRKAYDDNTMMDFKLLQETRNMLNLYEKVDVDEYWKNDTLINDILTDFMYTLPNFEELNYFGSENGAKVKGYYISRGLKMEKKFLKVLFWNDMLAEMHDTVLHLSNNGYSLHGNDVAYLFGYYFLTNMNEFQQCLQKFSNDFKFCHQLNTKSAGLEISSEELEFHLRYIDFILNVQCEQNDKWPMEVTVFSEGSASGQKVADFKKEELEFYKKIRALGNEDEGPITEISSGEIIINN